MRKRVGPSTPGTQVSSQLRLGMSAAGIRRPEAMAAPGKPGRLVKALARVQAVAFGTVRIARYLSGKQRAGQALASSWNRHRSCHRSLCMLPSLACGTRRGRILPPGGNEMPRGLPGPRSQPGKGQDLVLQSTQPFTEQSASTGDVISLCSRSFPACAGGCRIQTDGLRVREATSPQVTDERPRIKESGMCLSFTLYDKGSLGASFETRIEARFDAAGIQVSGGCFPGKTLWRADKCSLVPTSRRTLLAIHPAAPHRNKAFPSQCILPSCPVSITKPCQPIYVGTAWPLVWTQLGWQKAAPADKAFACRGAGCSSGGRKAPASAAGRAGGSGAVALTAAAS